MIKYKHHGEAETEHPGDCNKVCNGYMGGCPGFVAGMKYLGTISPYAQPEKKLTDGEASAEYKDFRILMGKMTARLSASRGPKCKFKVEVDGTVKGDCESIPKFVIRDIDLGFRQYPIPRGHRRKAQKA